MKRDGLYNRRRHYDMEELNKENVESRNKFDEVFSLTVAFVKELRELDVDQHLIFKTVDLILELMGYDE